jgi:DNA-binding CsgD family transcriptional regulator
MTEEVCETKAILLDTYTTKNLVHAEALRHLRSVMGIVSKREYELLYRTAENLRLEALAAQEELEQHTASHHC